jgi:adenylate kinase family enzyme
MKVNKIHIVGGPGSGKTYLAECLSTQLGISSYELDDIFWDNTDDCYGVKAEIQQRQNNLLQIVSQEKWIVEGVYYDWLSVKSIF